MIKKTLQIAGKIKMSSVNGEGLRYTIFLAGCPHKCDGCHSPHTWDYNYGDKEDIVDLFYDIYSKRHYIDGVSISGGEPLEQAKMLLPLLKMLKAFDTNIWLWTGYKFEYIEEKWPKILKCLDVIIDCQYDKTKPTTKAHRGSDNQRMWVNQGRDNAYKYAEVKE